MWYIDTGSGLSDFTMSKIDALSSHIHSGVGIFGYVTSY